jgi:hypothetical protein
MPVFLGIGLRSFGFQQFREIMKCSTEQVHPGVVQTLKTNGRKRERGTLHACCANGSLNNPPSDPG